MTEDRAAKTKRLGADRRREKRAFDRWKAPIGSACELTDDFGRKMLTTTRSMPWKLGDGTPVILVDGKVGGYLLTRIKVVLGESQG